MITSRAVFALHYSITGVSPRRHAATRDYAEALGNHPCQLPEQRSAKDQQAGSKITSWGMKHRGYS